ncbi:hypothetical protein EBZ39_17860 [bacterium]|nr:hypothetical protein [bacterium]
MACCCAAPSCNNWPSLTPLTISVKLENLWHWTFENAADFNGSYTLNRIAASSTIAYYSSTALPNTRPSVQLIVYCKSSSAGFSCWPFIGYTNSQGMDFIGPPSFQSPVFPLSELCQERAFNRNTEFGRGKFTILSCGENPLP